MTPTEAVRIKMRRLWQDHIAWTRLAVISILYGLPDTQATLSRLMRNQDEIGELAGRAFGKHVGSKLTELLKDHIRIAVELVVATKKADHEAMKKLNARWQANAEGIAAHLATVPGLEKAALSKMMSEHLRLTLIEVGALFAKKGPESVRAYDNALAQALSMADALSSATRDKIPGLKSMLLH